MKLQEPNYKKIYSYKTFFQQKKSTKKNLKNGKYLITAINLGTNVIYFVCVQSSKLARCLFYFIFAEEDDENEEANDDDGDDDDGGANNVCINNKI